MDKRELKIFGINKKMPKGLSPLDLNSSDLEIENKLKEIKNFNMLNETKEDLREKLKNAHNRYDELLIKIAKTRSDVNFKSALLGYLGIDTEMFREIRKTKYLTKEMISTIRASLVEGSMAEKEIVYQKKR